MNRRTGKRDGPEEPYLRALRSSGWGAFGVALVALFVGGTQYSTVDRYPASAGYLLASLGIAVTMVACGVGLLGRWRRRDLTSRSGGRKVLLGVGATLIAAQVVLPLAWTVSVRFGSAVAPDGQQPTLALLFAVLVNIPVLVLLIQNAAPTFLVLRERSSRT